MPDRSNIEHKTAFQTDGFTGPVPLLSRVQAHFLARHLLSLPERLPVWDKSLAAIDPLIHEVAADPGLLRILRDLLGEDIVLWGASVVAKNAGEVHPWHCDIESCRPEGGFASVWIGLLNTCKESGLRFLRGSHCFGTPIQELAAQGGISRDNRTDEAVMAFAGTRLAAPEIVQPEIVQSETGDGEALIFDGRIWHGSRNALSAEPRVALLLQYARADIPVNIPDYGDLEWPFRFRQDIRPPVVALGGQADPAVNSLVPAPSHRLARELPPTAHPIDRALRCKDGVPFESTHCFLGRTANADYLESHYSVLMPGCSPHPPHAHLDEEILVVMNGTAELVVPASPQAVEPQIFPAPAGTAIYYPPYQLHTIRNTGTEPVSYAMLRWKSAALSPAAHLTPQLLQASWLRKDDIPGPVAMKGFLEGPTAFLGKLHAHITRIRPGAGYGAHRDEHDVSIFLLEGEIAIMGSRIAAPALAFLPAGCLHDMLAFGSGLAKYLVWEFHRTDSEPRSETKRVSG